MYKATKNKQVGHVFRTELNHIKGAISLAAKDVKKTVKRQSANIQGKVADSIGDNPFRAVGIAMLSGMFLSMVMRRRRQSYRGDRFEH